jgi:hypothetical protein
MGQNLKLKKLLKKVLENKEYHYSYEDEVNSWNRDEIVYDDYVLTYTMEVKDVIGEGSDSVGGVNVIISDITKNDESIYHNWAEEDYSQLEWYISKLNDHLNDEVFSYFPFPIYPTFYGYDEKRR